MTDIPDISNLTPEDAPATAGRHRSPSISVIGKGWIPAGAQTATIISIGLMIILGLQGPRAGATAFAAAPPWPPWFAHIYPSPTLWSVMLWMTEFLGAVGLILGLLATRMGWRPNPRRLIACSVLAVVTLMLLPPVDNGDPVLYAAFGRIAVLGHSPYVMTPGQLKSSGDPVGQAVPPPYWDLPSRYGPIATVTEEAASQLGGDSTARTVFWLKVWDALAYLGLVAALDRLARPDPERRVRVHLLWSLNPLMLFAIMVNGHNDVLASLAGMSALLTLRRANSLMAFLSGVLLGVAIAIKAPYALFGLGLAWMVRRSRGAVGALALGTAAVVVPGYVLAGKRSISAAVGLTSVRPSGLWIDIVGLVGWQHELSRASDVALLGSAALSAILLWRMPAGPRDLPAVRVALALSLGLLVVAPQQTAWYDAMIFPLLALMPDSRLDWIAIMRALALTAASAPYFHPHTSAWLTTVERIGTAGSPTLILAAVDICLLWLCLKGTWKSSEHEALVP
jgi:alpha-1,6-mannosyltransferase